MTVCSGPIIRITPWEVHIADPDFYEVLFHSKTRYSKIEKLRYRFGLHLSSFDTIDHAHHHMRRSAVFPFFARQKVIDFSPQIQAMADQMVHRLATEFNHGAKAVNMNEAYAAFVSDAINYYTFAISYNFLDYPDFVTPFTTSIRKLAMSLHVAGHFPWFLTIMQTVPESVLQILNPLMVPVFQFHNVSNAACCMVLRVTHLGVRALTVNLVAQHRKSRIRLSRSYQEKMMRTRVSATGPCSTSSSSPTWLPKSCRSSV